MFAFFALAHSNRWLFVFFFLYSKWLFICAIPKCFVIFRRNQAIQSVVIGDWVKCNSLIVKLVFVLLLSNYCILHFISMKKKIVTLLTLYHFLFSYSRYSIFICFIFIELSIYSISYVNRKKQANVLITADLTLVMFFLSPVFSN